LARFVEIDGGVPVVVDVLRASSTIITALANGVAEVVPTNSKKDAFRLKKQGYVIAGEQYGVKLAGFDLGNSPTELLQFLKKKHWKSSL
jgi:2-phosphosulfolactate phosphatase